VYPTGLGYSHVSGLTVVPSLCPIIQSRRQSTFRNSLVLPLVSSLTEVTTDTTDRNDQPVVIGGIGNLVFLWLWRWSGGWVWGEGLPCPQIIVINFLSPPNTPFLLRVPIIDYAMNYYHELLHYRIKIMSYLC